MLIAEYGPVGSGYSEGSDPAVVPALIDSEASRQQRRFRVLARAQQLADEAVAPKVYTAANSSELPLIDVSALYDRDASDAKLRAAAQAVHNACIEHGFMYIKGTRCLLLCGLDIVGGGGRALHAAAVSSGCMQVTVCLRNWCQMYWRALGTSCSASLTP